MAVTYVGSPYHKRYPSPWGSPQPRSDATECPPEIASSVAAEVLTKGIETAIDKGWISARREGGWPVYAWGRSSFAAAETSVDLAWEARLVNSGQGAYKAYPIDEHRHSQEMPSDVELGLWPDS